MVKTKPEIAPGDKVTCLHPEDAYYSGYAGRPRTIFKPGMVGVVASIAPKVRIVGGPPNYDSRSEFVVVDYLDPVTGTSRVGLNFCNVERVQER